MPITQPLLLSGHCDVGLHHTCARDYGTPRYPFQCSCRCHTEPAPELKIGSTFSGYGGLDSAVTEVLGGRVVWHCEYQPPGDDGKEKPQPAAAVLAHRYPDVPNHGDIAKVEWDAVEPVDILTAGFPCQDVSVAGAQAGLRPGTRSGLWSQVSYAIGKLRPRLVVIENVGGLLSADAHSDVEWCPWCLGDDDEQPAVRALGAVLGDLAGIGFDAEWCDVRASDVGAPHGRRRIFIIAWPADSTGDPWWFGDGDGSGVTDTTSSGPQDGREGRPGRSVDGSTPDAGGASRGSLGNAERDDREGSDGLGSPESGGCGGITADAESDGREQGRPESARLLGGPDAALGRGFDEDECPTIIEICPDDPSRVHTSWGYCTTADAYSELVREQSVGQRGGGGTSVVGDAGPVDWGIYGPAVRRWESVLGRPAPSPWQISERTGNRQLSARFTEWLMGLPAGWVTDVPGMTRNAALHVLGNGVVPLQAVYALRLLLSVNRSAVASRSSRVTAEGTTNEDGEDERGASVAQLRPRGCTSA